MKKGIKVLLIILSVIIVIFLAVAIPIWVHQTDSDSYGQWGNWTSEDVFDIEKYPSIEIDDGKELKILQLADPQMKFGFMSRDVQTMDLITAALDEEKPDIVVCTGDLALSFLNTYGTYKYFADYMEARQQYWTVTYGNHDAEYDCSKYTLYRLLSNYKYCLFDCGPSNVTGESNHVITVKQSGEYVYALIMLDSNMYPKSNTEGGMSWVYDWIHPDQVEWYNWVAEGLKSVKADIRSSSFWHIPTIEWAQMYYKANTEVAKAQGVDTSKLLPASNVSGVVCENDKSADELIDDNYSVGIFYGGENSQEGRTSGQGSSIFAALKAQGITEAVYCGHDHVNTLRGDYGGIYLSYGLCCGYHTYPFFKNANWFVKLMGGEDSVWFNGSLWIDGNGNQMSKGVSIISVDTSGEYGSFTVTDHVRADYDR